MPSIVSLLQQRIVIPLLFIAILLIFLADSITQLGFAHGVLYTPLVLLAGLTFQYRVLNATSVMSILALWLGYLVSPAAPEGFATAYVLANRLLATLAITLLWCLSYQAITLQRQQQQQHAQEQLARLELSLANDVAALSHWRFNDYQKMVVLDDQSAVLLGRTDHELTLEQFIGCFAPTAQASLKEKLQLCLTQQQTVSLETRLHSNIKAPKWVKWVAFPDPANHDLVRGLLQNIEKHHQESNLFLEHQQRFQQLVDSLPVKVWTATEDGRVDFVSDTFVDYFGKSAADILANWVNLIHPDDQAETLLAWQHAVAHKTPYKVEFRIQREDGNYNWHLTSALPIYGSNAQLLYWFGSAMDISKQKALWLETDQLKHALYQILENVSDGFFMLDKSFHFTYVNHRALTLLAGKSTLAPGKHMTEVFYHPQIDFTALTSTIQRAFSQQNIEQLWIRLPEHQPALYVTIYPFSDGVNVLMQLTAQLKKPAA